jgi:hypothetical protein
MGGGEGEPRGRALTPSSAGTIYPRPLPRLKGGGGGEGPNPAY